VIPKKRFAGPGGPIFVKILWRILKTIFAQVVHRTGYAPKCGSRAGKLFTVFARVNIWSRHRYKVIHFVHNFSAAGFHKLLTVRIFLRPTPCAKSGVMR
jgi:hypothetical protein